MRLLSEDLPSVWLKHLCRPSGAPKEAQLINANFLAAHSKGRFENDFRAAKFARVNFKFTVYIELSAPLKKTVLLAQKHLANWQNVHLFYGQLFNFSSSTHLNFG